MFLKDKGGEKKERAGNRKRQAEGEKKRLVSEEITTGYGRNFCVE